MTADQYSRVAALHHALDQGAGTDEELAELQQHVHEQQLMTFTEGLTLALRRDLVSAALCEEGLLVPHLAREEREMMPVVAESISDAEWDRWNKDVNMADQKLRGLSGAVRSRREPMADR
jgi:hypothetical protein